MPAVNRVTKAAKDQGNCGKCGDPILKGQPYLWWKFQYGGKLKRCAKPECAPKPNDLTEGIDLDDHGAVLRFIGHPDNGGHDTTVCDCCGNGEDGWHGTPGHHYGPDDPRGPTGPYASNGGLAHCH